MRDSSIGFNRKSVSDGVPMLFGISIRMYLSSTVAEVVLTSIGETGGSCQRLHGSILCVTVKRKVRRKTRKETRKGGEHLDRKPHEGDKLKLT